MTPSAVSRRQEPADSMRRSRRHFKNLRRGAGELSWLVAGKAVLIGGNAALMLVLAERLDLKTYGLLITVISAQLLLSRFVLLGVETGIVRLHTVNDLQTQPERIVQAGLALLGYSSLALVFCCVAAWLVYHWTPSALLALVSAGIGTLGTSFIDYSYAVHLRQLRYRSAAFVQGVTALARFALTISVALLYPHRPAAIFLSYTGVSLLSGLIYIALVVKQTGIRRDRELMRRLLRYSFWPCTANIIVILGLYEGTFLLTALDREEGSGIFGLALSMSMAFFAVYNAYSEYLLPQFSRVRTRRELPRLLLRTYGGTALLIVSCVPVCWFIGWLVPYVLRPELHDAVPIFYTLSVSMILLMLQAPLQAASHFLFQPQFVTAAWAVRVVVIAVLGLALVPERGAGGMALAQVGGALAGLLTTIATGVAICRRGLFYGVNR